MTSVPPPSPVVATPSAGVGTTLVASDLPEGFARLPVGSRIVGQVAAAAPTGQVQIETPFGTISARAGNQLLKGAELHMVLQSVVPRLQLRIAAMGRETQATPSLYNASPSAVAARGQTGAPVTAPTSSGAPSTASPPVPSLTVGDTVSAILLKLSSETTAGTKIAPTNTLGTAMPGYGADRSLLGQSSGNLQSAQRMTVKVIRASSVQVTQSGTVPDNTPTAKTPGSGYEPGRILQAVATDFRIGGHAVVRTEAGPLALAGIATLPPGRSWTLQITSPLTLPQQATAGLEGSSSPLQPPSNPGIETLREALDVLHQVNPELATRVIDTVVPQATNSLAARILFLLSALQGGDVRSWIGESTIRNLRWARPDLANRLTETFAQLEHGGDSRETETWRALHIPFLVNGELQPIRLFTKQRRQGDGEDQEADEEPECSRFVVDFRLSRLGRLQLDGLVRDSGRRLDLIVRSEKPLVADVRYHIQSIFIEAGQLTGLKGGVDFQAQPSGFVEVAADEHLRLPTGVLV